MNLLRPVSKKGRIARSRNDDNLLISRLFLNELFELAPVHKRDDMHIQNDIIKEGSIG